MEPVEARAPQELSDHILATLAEIGEEINASLNLDKVLSKTAALVKRLSTTRSSASCCWTSSRRRFPIVLPSATAAK